MRGEGGILRFGDYLVGRAAGVARGTALPSRQRMPRSGLSFSSPRLSASVGTASTGAAAGLTLIETDH